jgi:hypothetical protein
MMGIQATKLLKLPTNAIRSMDIGEAGASPAHSAKENKMISVIGWMTVIYVIGCWILGIGILLLYPKDFRHMDRLWLELPLFILMMPLLTIAHLVEALIEWRSR